MAEHCVCSIHNRHMLRVFLVLLTFIPLSLAAQTVEELQARIAALMAQIEAAQASVQTTVPASCPTLVRTIGLGARGGDVTALQEFLRARGLLQSEATGYFGALTEAAVRTFQSVEGVVSSGDAASTGFGVVGTRTRAAIATRCGALTQAGAAQDTTMCPLAPAAPTIACAGSWQKLVSGACHTGWRCLLSNSGNKPPAIDAIQGPSALTVGQGGTWQIVAQDPEGGALTYSATWGDEKIEDILRSLAGFSQSFTASSVLSHAYARSGTFTMHIDVRDIEGNVSSATHAVTVSSGVGSTTAPASFLPPTSLATTNKSCVTPWGTQVIGHGQASFWQPFFTEGAYFPATSSPVVKCDNGAWLKCSAIGTECQTYVVPTSTSTGALQSYANVIGTPCSGKGSSRTVTVPPGTQLCQWLSCTVTTEARTVTLQCTDGGWSDYKSY